MADAYGAIVVGFSDNFKGDLDAIAKSLTGMNLDNEGGRFVVKDGNICCEAEFDGAQYPTLTPMRDKLANLMTDGKEVSDIKQQEFKEVVEQEEVPLSEIANDLVKFISKGTLFLTCCSHEKQRSVDSEYMSIAADGSAERFMISHWVGKQAVYKSEKC